MQSNIVKHLITRLKTFVQTSEYPKFLEITDIVPGPLRFNICSAVEEYRVAEHGGEREALEHFLDLLKPTDVVYDIGASVGLYTITAATLLEKGEVYAFEPDPSTCARLQENVWLNRLRNVHIVKWAVSDSQGETLLYTDGAAGNAPSFLFQSRPGAPRGQVHVPTSSLDLAVSQNEVPLPDVLKIDIEGAEGLCLRGSRQLLTGLLGKPPRVVFLELHPEFLPGFSSSEAEIKEAMVGFGYTAHWSQKRDLQEHVCYVYSD